MRHPRRRSVSNPDLISSDVTVGQDFHDDSEKKAYERKDSRHRLSVNLLIMAKNKMKNTKEDRVTAGDLLGKLGKKSAEIVSKDEKFLDDSEHIDKSGEVFYDESLDNEAIDVSSTGRNNESDSDLDINELLQKYMLEFDTDEKEDDIVQSGTISQLRKNASQAAPDLTESEDSVNNGDANGNGISDDDEKLMDALDSAFGTSLSKPKKTGLFKFKSNKSVSDETISEYDIEDETEDSFIEDETLSDDNYDDEVDDAVISSDDDVREDELADENIKELLSDEDTKKKSEGMLGLFLRNKNKKEIADKRQGDEVAVNTGINADEDPNDNDNGSEHEISEDGGSYSEASDDTEISAEDSAENTDSADSDAEFDPTDINLMVAFGLDGGENKKADKAKELGDRFEANQSEYGKKIKLDRPEFVDKTQTPEIRKEFKRREIGLWIRLGLCAVFSILLLVFENITVFTKMFTGSSMQFAGVFDPAVYPVVYIMVSLQFMLLACVCAYDEIINGFKYILRGIPRPESLTSVMMLAGIIYSIVVSRVCTSPNEPVMFNFVVALSAFLTIIYSIFNNKREMMNFRVVANKKAKHIVRRLRDEESECESKAFADNDDVCDVMKIEKTGFIDGFFGRLEKPDRTTNLFITFAMSISVALAVIFGIIMNIKGGDAPTVCSVVYAAFLIIAPLSVFVTFAYPFYRANLAAREYDSAIMGETSLEEYSNASIISFDDKNVFPSYSVKVQNIRIYNNARIDRVLYYAASVFAYAGGPLQDVFEVATKDMGTSSDVKIFDTEVGFLATQVDGVNIIFGNGDTLIERGLEIPESALKDDVDLSDELSIMYMFRENKLVAKMYIKYVMDSDIDLILKQFSGSGLYVCVRTFDPNIDERMIAKKAGMKRMPLKIVRYASADEVGAFEAKAESGLVTCGSPKSLLQVISYCGKVLHTKKTNIALSVLSVFIGVAILALLILSDSVDSISSLFIAIYQLIWLIPMIISSKMFIR